MSDRINFSNEGGIATITMDDGKVNVMSRAMLRDLGEAFDRAEKEAKAVILRSGRPGIFSAGFDLKVFAARDAQGSTEMVRTGAELALRLLSFPMPTIGVMAGHAYPMGTFLLLACDLRLAARGPFRMGLNEVAIRITPPTFAIELARSRVHPSWLSRTVTLGEMFEPDEALTAGFLDKVVAPEVLEAAAKTSAIELASLDNASHVGAKKRLRAAAMTAVRAAIDAELTLSAYEARAAGSLGEVVLPR